MIFDYFKRRTVLLRRSFTGQRFTLFAVMVALFIFAVVAVIATVGLESVIHISQRLERA